MSGIIRRFSAFSPSRQEDHSGGPVEGEGEYQALIFLIKPLEAFGNR